MKYSEVEVSVRNGLQPDNPKMLVTYLEMTYSKMQDENDVQCKRAILGRVLATLLDTICDTFVAHHWRQACLSYVYKPQLSLEQLCFCKQDRIDNLRFRRELITLSHYFL